jgi:hypothetical protein
VKHVDGLHGQCQVGSALSLIHGQLPSLLLLLILKHRTINLYIKFKNSNSNDNFYTTHISIPRMLTALRVNMYKCIEAVPAKDSNPGRRRANPPL